MPEYIAKTRPLTIFVPHTSDMLTDYMPHGDGQIGYALLSELARRGHQVYAVASRLEVKGTLVPGLHVHLIPTAPGMLNRLHYMQQMRAYFLELRQVVSFDFIHQSNPVFTGVSLFLLGSRLPQVMGPYFAQWPHDPNTITGGEGPLRRLIVWLQRRIAATQQKYADLLLLTGPGAKERLPYSEEVMEKVRWLGLGTDTKFFSPAPDYLSDERLQREQEAPSVLFLANVSKRKGIFPLVDAWKLVTAEIPNAILRVAGVGPDLKKMKKRARKAGVKDSIVFHGQQQRGETPDFYRNHAVYVLPSFGEPYGLSLQEAMCCGRPVISTSAGGPLTLVQPQGGILVPVNDPPTLADAILQLLRDPQRRRSMAAYNRRRALETMAWPCVAEQLEGYYAELIPPAGICKM